MEITEVKTVGEIVAQSFKAADVFKKYGIDFCCGGGRSLADVCVKKNLNYAEIEGELLAIDTSPGSENFGHWELDTLIEHIIGIHHRYVNDNIPLIIAYSDKVAKVHGQNYSETIEINRLFHLVADELIDHMYKEEKILFPYILSLLNRKGGYSTTSHSPSSTIETPIRMMMIEHDDVGSIFHSISEYSKNYTPPVDACTTYKILYNKLHEFEMDLHKHIHLENNILFPNAIELEKIISY